VVDGYHRFADNQYEIGGYTGRVMVTGSEQAIARTN
jgi:hypothetical protein